MELNHVGTRTLKTTRLVLRPFCLSDAQAMYDNWASDSDVTKFMMWEPHASVEVTQSILESWMPLYEKPDYYHWAITLDNVPIGTVGLFILNEKAGVGDLGYCLSKKWWKHGIMSEAVQAVIDFAFETVGFERIEAHHSVDNPGSGGVMKKCGMLYEGQCAKSTSVPVAFSRTATCMRFSKRTGKEIKSCRTMSVHRHSSPNV